jgi:hypothetical protein
MECDERVKLSTIPGLPCTHFPPGVVVAHAHSTHGSEQTSALVAVAVVTACTKWPDEGCNGREGTNLQGCSEQGGGTPSPPVFVNLSQLHDAF